MARTASARLGDWPAPNIGNSQREEPGRAALAPDGRPTPGDRPVKPAVACRRSRWHGPQRRESARSRHPPGRPRSQVQCPDRPSLATAADSRHSRSWSRSARRPARALPVDRGHARSRRPPSRPLPLPRRRSRRPPPGRDPQPHLLRRRLRRRVTPPAATGTEPVRAPRPRPRARLRRLAQTRRSHPPRWSPRSPRRARRTSPPRPPLPCRAPHRTRPTDAASGSRPRLDRDLATFPDLATAAATSRPRPHHGNGHGPEAARFV